MLRRTPPEPRSRIDRLFDAADRRADLHDATFWSLRQRTKEIPAVWLYDQRGSQLFEKITRLPEYYLFRRESEILLAHAEEIASRTEARTLIELGSGTSEKTRLLLDALDASGTLERFMPLDASEAVLRASAFAAANRYPTIGVHAVVGDFERHLGALPDAENRLVAFLGSTIGNLEPQRRVRLLETVASVLAPGDAFLLGLDLVKAPERIEAAYNDSLGITESFVRNGLDVLNRELSAEFAQENYDFVARWDVEHEWMDIGFRARTTHTVAIRGLDVSLALVAREPLRFEISTKFRRDLVQRELAEAGLRLDMWWADAAGDFGLVLAEVSPKAAAP
jgi:L-histidine N-alpha-methyltransferase